MSLQFGTSVEDFRLLHGSSLSRVQRGWLGVCASSCVCVKLAHVAARLCVDSKVKHIAGLSAAWKVPPASSRLALSIRDPFNVHDLPPLSQQARWLQGCRLI